MTKQCERCQRRARISGLESMPAVGRFETTYPSGKTVLEWLCASHLSGLRQVMFGGSISEVLP